MTRGPSREASPLVEWRTLVVESDLRPLERHVALTLSLHMDRNGGSCFPSITRQQRETGLARSTVCLALDALEAARLITRSRGGRGRPTRYIATSPPHGLPLVRVTDTTSPPHVPEDVPEDVHKTSLRKRDDRPARNRPAVDLSYLDEVVAHD